MRHFKQHRAQQIAVPPSTPDQAFKTSKMKAGPAGKFHLYVDSWKITAARFRREVHADLAPAERLSEEFR